MRFWNSHLTVTEAAWIIVLEDHTSMRSNSTSGIGVSTEGPWATTCNAESERRCKPWPVPTGASGGYVVQSEDVCACRDGLSNESECHNACRWVNTSNTSVEAEIVDPVGHPDAGCVCRDGSIPWWISSELKDWLVVNWVLL